MFSGLFWGRRGQRLQFDSPPTELWQDDVVGVGAPGVASSPQRKEQDEEQEAQSQRSLLEILSRWKPNGNLLIFTLAIPVTLVDYHPTLFFFKKMDQPRPLFRLFSSLKAHITNFTTNRYVKKCPSSRYTVPGFELTTFGTWVSSHDH